MARNFLCRLCDRCAVLALRWSALRAAWPAGNIQARIFRVLGACCLFLAILVVPIMLVDAHFYGSWTFAAWNIVRYNVVSNKSGIYGIEGWQFYLRNGVVNFSTAFLLSVPSILIAALSRKRSRPTCTDAFSALYMGSHNAESRVTRRRFLYVVYPLICLGASVSSALLARFLREKSFSARRRCSRLLRCSSTPVSHPSGSVR